MKYDMELHIPNQVETLLHYRSQSDIASFEYILDGLKKLMSDHKEFLDGLSEDQKKRDMATKDLYKKLKEAILKAFKDENDEDSVLITAQLVSQLEPAYGDIERRFMTDVITTITSYDDGRETDNE